jgi:hypothetical protein
LLNAYKDAKWKKSTTETSGEKVTYAYTTYKEQEVVIVEFVDFSAQHVWDRLVANEKKQILIDWTTEPGIFLVKKWVRGWGKK